MKFVLLIDFTDKARQNPKSIQEFAAKQIEFAKSLGVTIEQRYWGIGGMHDIVVVLDAPDGNAIAKLITRGHPLAGRSRSTDISREKEFSSFPLFLFSHNA